MDESKIMSTSGTLQQSPEGYSAGIVPRLLSASATDLGNLKSLDSYSTSSRDTISKSIARPSTKLIRKKDITAFLVADWIISFCQDHGDVITNLRLQRLLYFAQAWHLAINGEPLFRATFEAWPNGPINSEVYSVFEHYEFQPIQAKRPKPRFSNSVENFLFDLMATYGTINAFELELQAQRDLPWVEARAGLSEYEPSRNKIKDSTMKIFYRKRLNEQKKAEEKGPQQ